MELSSLRVGMQCTLSDGSLAEVQGIRADNIHVQVKYLDSLDNPEIPDGSERDVPYEEIIAEFMGTHAEGLA